MLNRSILKREAKNINRSAAVNAYRFTFLFFLIILVLNVLQNYFDSASLAEQLTIFAERMDLPAFLERLSDRIISLCGTLPEFPAATVTFVLVITRLLSFLLIAGYLLYLMGIRQGRVMGYGTLFDGFAFAGKILALELLRTLIVLLWSFLFLIPGIIASYRYSFALYNLLDHPERSVAEAMALSKQQTRDHKWDLFVLDLSFIGWDLLQALTAGILAIYVKPYREQTWLGYYRALTGTDPCDDASSPPENYEYHCIDDNKNSA